MTSNHNLIDVHKVFLPAAYGERTSSSYYVIGNPFYGSPNTICTETYIAAAPFSCRAQCESLMSYMRTKFFRFLVLIRKPTQHLLRQVYSFVPIQDFSKPWTDVELYKKYKLTKDEIAFIESMIKPME